MTGAVPKSSSAHAQSGNVPISYRVSRMDECDLTVSGATSRWTVQVFCNFATHANLKIIRLYLRSKARYLSRCPVITAQEPNITICWWICEEVGICPGFLHPSDSQQQCWTERDGSDYRLLAQRKSHVTSCECEQDLQRQTLQDCFPVWSCDRSGLYGPTDVEVWATVVTVPPDRPPKTRRSPSECER